MQNIKLIFPKRINVLLYKQHRELSEAFKNNVLKRLTFSGQHALKSLHIYPPIIYLKGEFISCLGDVSLDNMSSCNSRNINGRLLVNQEAIPLVINLQHKVGGEEAKGVQVWAVYLINKFIEENFTLIFKRKQS